MTPSATSRNLASREMIIASARREIERHGILGLRVADVAAGANCSITQIYRYFGDRNGLLAQVLGDIYDEMILGVHRAFMEAVDNITNLTLDDIVNLLPAPNSDSARRNQEIRLQILAASVNNVPLRERLEETTRAQWKVWTADLERIARRLPEGKKFDARVFTISLAMQVGYYRSLMDDTAFTDDEYRQFIKDKLGS